MRFDERRTPRNVYFLVNSHFRGCVSLFRDPSAFLNLNPQQNVVCSRPVRSLRCAISRHTSTPQPPTLRGTAAATSATQQKNKTKKYLGTHTRRPCGGYWVAPRLLRIGRNERDTTGTQQNTGNRYLTVIYSSFNRHLCHPIPPVFNCWFAVAVPLLCRCSNGRQLPFIRPLISR